jgi:hypothetical protein
MPCYIYMTCLKTFEAYGRKNYNYMKVTVGAIQASWGDKAGEEVKFRQDLGEKAGAFPFAHSTWANKPPRSLTWMRRI